MQLELNLENRSPLEMQVAIMQKQIDLLSESTAKTRKRLFAEIGDLKKTCQKLEQENQSLRIEIEISKSEKCEWRYLEGGSLFEYKQKIG